MSALRLEARRVEEGARRPRGGHAAAGRAGALAFLLSLAACAGGPFTTCDPCGAPVAGVPADAPGPGEDPTGGPPEAPPRLLPGVFGAHTVGEGDLALYVPLTVADLKALGADAAKAEGWRSAHWWFVRKAPPSAPDVGARETYVTADGALRIGTRRLTLELDPATSEDRARDLFQAWGLTLLSPQGDGFFSARVPLGRDPFALAKGLRSHPEVRSVEVELLRLLTGRAGGDPRLGDQWQWNDPGPSAGGVQMNPVWSAGGDGHGTRIAVIDFTFETDHEDLKAGIDTANSGAFVESVWNGTTEFVYPLPRDPSDPHGTEVAGLAGARGWNDKGGRGAAPKSMLRLVSIPKCASADVVRWAFRFAYDPACAIGGPPRKSAHVVTSSVGWTGPATPEVAAAVKKLLLHGRGGLGTPVFWALTNADVVVTSSTDGIAALPHVLGIGATKIDDTRLDGGKGPLIDLVAPGQEVLTTTSATTSSYFADQGCSMATPIVAGIAAVLIQRVPGITRAQIRDVLCRSADKVGGPYPSGHSDTFGFGRVNAKRALYYALATYWP